MRLVTFTEKSGAPKVGKLVGKEVVEFDKALFPNDMVSLLEVYDNIKKDLERFNGRSVSLERTELIQPVIRPQKILAIGLNYKDHIQETGFEKPEFPLFFNKQLTSVNGPFGDIHLPRVSDKLDYEGELGFIIGKKCRHVSKEDAKKVIAGFVTCNDVSVRDWQMRSPTFTLGKSFDTHSPFGPHVTTFDEVKDPHNLSIKTWVNGELRQDSNTSNLAYDCYDQIETLSTAFTLEPGDLIMTGTPGGVGIGFEPKRYLKAGDVVKIEIEKVGIIQNKVVNEP